MIVGQGNAFVSPNTATPGGAPFPAGSAENGLSVDPITGRIVLGNDLFAAPIAQLLNSREIDLNSFLLMLSGTNNNVLFEFADDAVPQVFFRDGATGFGLDINWTAPYVHLGDTGLASGFLNINPGYLEGVGSLTEYLALDGSVFQTRLGDAYDNGNGNKLFIDDPAQRWSLGQEVAITNMLLNFPGAGIGLAFFDSVGTNPFLLPDPATGGSAFIAAPDFTTAIALADAANGRIITMGDLNTSNSGMVAAVDVVNSLFSIADTANNAAVRINGVNGFTGVVAPPLTITVDGGIVTNVA